MNSRNTNTNQALLSNEDQQLRVNDVFPNLLFQLARVHLTAKKLARLTNQDSLAEICDVSQSTVNKVIQRVEAELKV